jgi:hypothetical protein
MPTCMQFFCKGFRGPTYKLSVRKRVLFFASPSDCTYAAECICVFSMVFVNHLKRLAVCKAGISIKLQASATNLKKKRKNAMNFKCLSHGQIIADIMSKKVIKKLIHLVINFLRRSSWLHFERRINCWI